MIMAYNSDNARIFGGDNDAVFVGPLGTTLPTDLETAPDSALVDVGWLHADGITVTPEDSVEKFRGHQGARIIRTKVTESGTTFQFQALESKTAVLGLQYNIQDHTDDVGGDFTVLELSPSRKVAPRAMVIDVYDEEGGQNGLTVQHRLVIPRAEIGERQEFTLANSDITGYTFTVEIIGNYSLITNDPAAFAA